MRMHKSATSDNWSRHGQTGRSGYYSPDIPEQAILQEWFSREHLTINTISPNIAKRDHKELTVTLCLCAKVLIAF